MTEIRPELIVPPNEHLDDLCEAHFPLLQPPSLLALSSNWAAVTSKAGITVHALEDGRRLWHHERRDAQPVMMLHTDGDRVIAAAADGIEIYDEKGGLITKLDAPEEGFTFVDVSPEARRMVALSADRFYEYDLDSLGEIRVVAMAEDYAVSDRDGGFDRALVVPDGVVCPIGRELTIWRDGELDQLVFRTALPRYYYGGGAWTHSTDGELLVEIADAIQAFDARTFELVFTADTSAMEGRFIDNDRIAVWDQWHVAIHDVRNGTQKSLVAPWRGHSDFVVVDERTAYSISMLGELCRWDLASWAPMEGEEVDYSTRQFAGVAISPDAATAVAVDHSDPRHLWTIPLSGGAREKSHPHAISADAGNPVFIDDHHVAMARESWGQPAGVLVWNLNDDAITSREFEHVLHVDSRAALVSQGQKVRRLALPSLEVEREVVLPPHLQVQAGVDDTPKWIACYDSKLEDDVLWDVERLAQASGGSTQAKGRLMVTETYDETTWNLTYLVRDVETGDELGSVDNEDVYGVVPSGRNGCLFVQMSQALAVWKPGAQVEEFWTTGDDWVSHFDVSADEKWLIAAGERIFIWDAAAPGEPVYNFEPQIQPTLIHCENGLLFVSNAFGLYAVYRL